MADFSIKTEGLRPIERRLGRLLAKFEDLVPLMDAVGRSLVSSTRSRFETGTAPDGTSWIPSFRAKAEGGVTLVKSGQLRDSITHLAGPNRVEVGTNKIYAAVHQFGATIHPTGDALRFELPGIGLVFAKEVIVPARPYVGISESDEAGVVRLTEKYAGAALEGF